MKQASATHSPCTDGGTEERIHPAYQMYFDMKDANPGQGEKARKNREKCAQVEKDLNLRAKAITGKRLHELAADADDEERLDDLVENGCAVEDKEVVEVVKTTKKRKRRKLSPPQAQSETDGVEVDDGVGGFVAGFEERKNRIYDMMEGFLSNSSSARAIEDNDPDRPYKNLDLEELQEKIEKQEEKIASASNAIVKQCGEKIMTQLVEEVKIRLS